MSSPISGMDNPSAAEEGQAGNKYAFQFNDKTIRAAFVRKVFALVTIMLLVVAIMTAVPFFDDNIRVFVQKNVVLYWLGYVVFLIVYIALICCDSVRRSFPANLIMTGILTLAMGFMTMVVTAHYSLESVLLTLIITTVCCGSIIVFASQTKYDLTELWGIVFILSIFLFVFGIVAIVAIIAFKVYFLYTIYAGLAAIIFMFYLAIDIQMLMGGRKYEISPEEYIFAAIQIFLDVVLMFWMLLTLFGSNR